MNESKDASRIMNESRDASRIMNESRDASRLMNESRDAWRDLVLSARPGHSSGESEVNENVGDTRVPLPGSSYSNGLTTVRGARQIFKCQSFLPLEGVPTKKDSYLTKYLFGICELNPQDGEFFGQFIDMEGSILSYIYDLCSVR